MNLRPKAQLDDRDLAQIVSELLARRPGYVPDWNPAQRGAGWALAWIFGRYLNAVIQRLNQAPDKNKLAFLDTLNFALVPAQAARAPIVFQLAPDASDQQAPAGTQIAAPPPPESTDQVVFETESATGLAVAQLKQVVSLWPGRDQYIDHSAAFLANKPFQPFLKHDLVDTPHDLYIADDMLLALAGDSTLEIEFELTQVGSKHLDILWRYWDGKVWRDFMKAQPACGEVAAAAFDSTQGLTRSGRYRLETACAESAKTIVNGVEAFWIRGQLDEALLPDPTQALPLVESIRLSTLIDRGLKALLQPIVKQDTAGKGGPGVTTIHGAVLNEAGQPLSGVVVKITDPTKPAFDEVAVNASTEGAYTTEDALASSATYQISTAFLELDARTTLRNLDDDRDLEIDLTFTVEGLSPDKAFSDGTALDVTKPFFPFGQQPQPGSTFYFNQEEVFSKPGAKVQIYVARTASPQDAFDITKAGTSDNRLDHRVDWDYWNGEKWVTFMQSSPPPQSQNAAGIQAPPEPLADLDVTEIIEFEVPRDMVRTKVNDQEGFWVRVRLVSGGFGIKQTFQFSATGVTGANTISYVISRPPSLAAFWIGYTWQHGPFHPEHVVAYNDFTYVDRTYEAIWPGNPFPAFDRVSDVTPALYLGFDKKLPVDRIGLYFDVVEKRGDTNGPALVWEYWTAGKWSRLSAADETRNLRLPGILSFIGAQDSNPLARFGTELHWVRGRLKEDGPPGEPTVNGIFPNAVWASQQATLNDSPLGLSNGMADQVFSFTQIPVLAGERIEVQELAGARANVEWRILATEVAGGDQRVIAQIEDLLSREGAQVEVISGDLRLRRDRNKLVTEVWVRWVEQPHLFHSGPDDRHYVLDRTRGLLFFGDGVHGKIPPPAASIMSRRHRVGGGLVGNLPARTITQLLGALSGVQSIFNPRAAEGGADSETIEKLRDRGPRSLRHRGRALTPSDYETLAREASPAVAVARAIPTRNASGRRAAGWVTLLIIPQSRERRPLPSFGLREHVRKFIAGRAPAGPACSGQLYITGPDYLPVDVSATLAPKSASEAGTVEMQARLAIEEFLHPLRGGPEGRGWELGRDLYLSDVAAVIERVEGVDYVEELALLIGGGLQGDQVAIADDRIVVAGDIRLKLKAAEA